jgi:hypothetical protein
MTDSSLRIIDSPTTVADSPRSGGIIDRLMFLISVRLAGRRYERQLKEHVRRRLETQILPPGEATEGQQMDQLLAGASMDFPPHLQARVLERGRHLDLIIRDEVQSAALRFQDEFELCSQRAEDISSDLTDMRNHRQSIDSFPYTAEPPPSFDSLKERFFLEGRLNHVYSALGQLRTRAMGAFSAAAFVLLLEGTLVYLSLQPAFYGLPGISSWILPAQALLITMVMLYLAHKVKDTKSGQIRWLPAATLGVIALSLALLRVGVMAYKSGDLLAAANEATIESWAIVLLLFLGGVCLALIGGEAFRRGTQALSRSTGIRQSLGENLTKMEAELGAARAEEANRRAFLRRQQDMNERILPRIGRGIRRRENRLRGEHAAARKLAQREIDIAVSRMSCEISCTSRQLALWYHGRSPDSSTTPRPGPLLLILLCVSMLTSSCSPLDQSSLGPHSKDLLIDTSASMPSELHQRVRDQVAQQLASWVTTAQGGEKFNVWWLTPTGAPYPADRHSFVMPPLRVPAHVHRARVSAELQAELAEALDALCYRVKTTPLLEAMYYIGSTRHGHWSLTVFSDLQQDSPAWHAAIRHLSTGSDEEIVSAMLSICPVAETPPFEVSVFSWPGLVGKHQTSINQHGRHSTLFRLFLGAWAPDAGVHMMPID